MGRVERRNEVGEGAGERAGTVLSICSRPPKHVRWRLRRPRAPAPPQRRRLLGRTRSGERHRYSRRRRRNAAAPSATSRASPAAASARAMPPLRGVWAQTPGMSRRRKRRTRRRSASPQWTACRSVPRRVRANRRDGARPSATAACAGGGQSRVRHGGVSHSTRFVCGWSLVVRVCGGLCRQPAASALRPKARRRSVGQAAASYELRHRRCVARRYVPAWQFKERLGELGGSDFDNTPCRSTMVRPPPCPNRSPDDGPHVRGLLGCGYHMPPVKTTQTMSAR